MLIRTEDARYLHAVATALAAGTLPVSEQTVECPECGEEQTYNANDGHVVVLDNDNEDFDEATALVVIACEGLWVVNPAAVGIDFPLWQEWKVGKYVDMALNWIREDMADNEYPDGPPRSTADLPANRAHEAVGLPFGDDEYGQALLHGFYAELDRRLQAGEFDR